MDWCPLSTINHAIVVHVGDPLQKPDTCMRPATDLGRMSVCLFGLLRALPILANNCTHAGNGSYCKLGMKQYKEASHSLLAPRSQQHGLNGTMHTGLIQTQQQLQL